MFDYFSRKRCATRAVLFFGWAVAFQARASSPQSSSQVYALNGEHKDQIVMLSNWSKERTFAAFEVGNEPHFTEQQRVWIWCSGESSVNKIDKIVTGQVVTEITLVSKPKCTSKPQLMSNYDFPKKTWKEEKLSGEVLLKIKSKMKVSGDLKATKIVSEKKGTFYLVFDPKIKSVYDAGGYLLLNDRYDQISKFEGGGLTPLIDLNADSVPEFFFPSSDGDDAWLYEMYPKHTEIRRK